MPLRAPTSVVVAASTLLVLGCLDQNDPASVSRQLNQMPGNVITVACDPNNGDRTLELRDAIQSLKAAGGGTLRLESKVTCPNGYQYSAQYNPRHTDYGAGAFNGYFDDSSSAFTSIPVTIESDRAPIGTDNTR